jgi:hypothetical protein
VPRVSRADRDEGRFAPGGFIHLDCRRAYFETDDVAAPVLHFSRGLSEEDRAELATALGSPGP